MALYLETEAKSESCAEMVFAEFTERLEKEDGYITLFDNICKHGATSQGCNTNYRKQEQVLLILETQDRQAPDLMPLGSLFSWDISKDSYRNSLTLAKEFQKPLCCCLAALICALFFYSNPKCMAFFRMTHWDDHQYACMSVAQSRPSVCVPMDCSLPGSSVHGIFRARILEWVAMYFSRGSPQPRDGTHVSCISCSGRQILCHWATWES